MTGFFVTGTDTEIGKTYCTCLLIRHLADKGKRVGGLKPIASGCDETSEGLKNTDALAIQSAASVDLPYSLINRYRFKPAIAPHIAAQQTHTEISFKLIAQDMEEVATKTDIFLVEGAGGWRVPLSETSIEQPLDMAGLATQMQLPVILVVGIKLGCINHARLTLDSIRHFDVPVAGWIANHLQPDTQASRENVQTLKQILDAPMIAEIGCQQTQLDPEFDFLAKPTR